MYDDSYIMLKGGYMKYISRIHITVKLRKNFSMKWFLKLMHWGYKNKKVLVYVSCKGKRGTYANAFYGHDTQIFGKVSKVREVEFVFPWDYWFLAMVWYRGGVSDAPTICKPTTAETNRYGKK